MCFSALGAITLKAQSKYFIYFFKDLPESFDTSLLMDLDCWPLLDQCAMVICSQKEVINEGTYDFIDENIPSFNPFWKFWPTGVDKIKDG